MSVQDDNSKEQGFFGSIKLGLTIAGKIIYYLVEGIGKLASYLILYLGLPIAYGAPIYLVLWLCGLDKSMSAYISIPIGILIMIYISSYVDEERMEDAEKNKKSV